MRIFPLILILTLFLSGCVASSNHSDLGNWIKQYDASDINANPSILNNTIVKVMNLDGLRLENVTIRHATLMQTKSDKAYLKNVIFENCRFINAHFTNSTFENVTFKGGLMTCKNDADNIAEQTTFSNTTFTNVLLDGMSLDNTAFGLSNSSVHFKNMHNMQSLAPMITGTNVKLTFENCIVRNMTVTDLSNHSIVEAKDCIFDAVTLGKGTFASVRLLNCITHGSPIYTQEQIEKPRKRK